MYCRRHASILDADVILPMAILTSFVIAIISLPLFVYWSTRLWMILQMTEEELDLRLSSDYRIAQRLWFLLRMLLFPRSMIGV